MRKFRVALTGDFLDESGSIAYGDIGLQILTSKPYVEHHLLTEQAPPQGDKGYWSRVYALEVTADQIQGVNGLIVLRPWLKRHAFSRGAEDLVAIGRSGAGYDKIDLDAC